MKILIVAGAVVALLASAHLAELRPSDPTSDSTHTIQAAFGDTSSLGKVLTRSCGDCHSNVMVAGWYTRIPPFSSIMKRAASEGRKAVNFAEWAGYTPEQRRAYLIASCADAKSGKMPVGSYLHFRADAKLSSADVEIICGAAK